MKKYLVLTLIVSMFVGLLTGCGSNNQKGEYLIDFNADKFVTLGSYKGIEIFIPAPADVTDEEVDATMESILMYYPMFAPVDGPSEVGDRINIDFVGTKDGVAFEGGSFEGWDDYILGSYRFIPDLDEGMIGMSLDDVWEIPVTFPEDYNTPDLAGAEAIFTVTMNMIERPLGMTDEYVALLTNSEFTNVGDFREHMRELSIAEAEMAYKNEVASQIAMVILEDSSFKPMPTGLISRLSDILTNTMTYYAYMNEMDLYNFMMLSGMLYDNMTPEEVITEQAEKTAQHYMAFQAIADIEGLNVTDEEANLGIATMAEADGMTVEDFMAGTDFESYKEYLMLEKVSDFLMENAVIIH